MVYINEGIYRRNDSSGVSAGIRASKNAGSILVVTNPQPCNMNGHAWPIPFEFVEVNCDYYSLFAQPGCHGYRRVPDVSQTT